MPDVTPQQINAARQIKKYFTGDLDANVLHFNFIFRALLFRIARHSAIHVVAEKQDNLFLYLFLH